MSTRGRHLVASPSLNDPNFEFTVVFMLEHSDEGALGVVLTRPSELPVTDMFDGWVDHAAAPSVVFRGGPVSLSSVIALGVAASAGPSGGFNPIAAGIGTVDLDTDPAELIALQGVRFSRAMRRGLLDNSMPSWSTTHGSCSTQQRPICSTPNRPSCGGPSWGVSAATSGC